MGALISVTLDGQEQLVTRDEREWTYGWDYHERTGRLVFTNSKRTGFGVLQVRP